MSADSSMIRQDVREADPSHSLVIDNLLRAISEISSADREQISIDAIGDILNVINQWRTPMERQEEEPNSQRSAAVSYSTAISAGNA